MPWKSLPETTSVATHLASALSELKSKFSADNEKLHLAVALVFSSIFNAAGLEVIIVGGQAATYWLRSDGSRDADFSTPLFETFELSP